MRQTVFTPMSSVVSVRPGFICVRSCIHPRKAAVPAGHWRLFAVPLRGGPRDPCRRCCPERGCVTAAVLSAAVSLQPPRQRRLSRQSAFCAVPVPAALPGAGGPGRHRSGLGLAQQSATAFPPSLNLFPAPRLPAPGPDVLSAAPGGSWKQKMLLPLVTAEPARVPAGKS